MISLLVVKYPVKKIYFYLFILSVVLISLMLGKKYLDSSSGVLNIKDQILLQKQVKLGIEKRIKELNLKISKKNELKQKQYFESLKYKKMLSVVNLNSFGAKLIDVTPQMEDNSMLLKIEIKEGESRAIIKELLRALLPEENLNFEFKTNKF